MSILLAAKDSRNISSNGTVCPPAIRIVDSAKNVWVVSDGVVLKNGENAAFTEQVTLLVYYEGIIYQQNLDGAWWAWNGGDWVGVTGDPRPPKNQLFYGINSHYPRGEFAYGLVPVDKQLKQMMNLGARTIRVGVTTDSEIARMRSLLQALTGTGMQAYPCLDVYLTKDANTSPFDYSEPYYYDIGFSTGARVANSLKGLVKYYEIGNEIDSQALISASVDGNSKTDYDNQWFILARGLILGLADGVKSVDTSAAIIGPACSWLHLAFLDLLWNGVQPNGGTGNP
ncbi:hypothetical protein KQH49_07630 [Mycetohabitans sp. B5]|uniref:hypothetical protein n=1 Tax=Mycetohabitans sp. B5 TaxID=2841846 RepID=UPI001F3017EB|nr:hypothetical protein [Mycetohabitans sp. B5]MCG1054829.1 hypothetical protein [Mycetohabitans sp. B5]